MTVRDPYLCLICNRVMVLRRCVPNREGQALVAPIHSSWDQSIWEGRCVRVFPRYCVAGNSINPRSRAASGIP